MKTEKPVKVKGTDPMKKFWGFRLSEIERKPFCQETNQRILPEVSSVCHIFPKRKTGGYPSVGSNLLNAMSYHPDIHSRFDRLLDELDFVKLEKEFSNSWPEVIEKASVLLPLIKENGKLKTKFEDYLKNKEI